MIHSEGYYQPLGICIRCGAQAGVLRPLKIIDEIVGVKCET